MSFDLIGSGNKIVAVIETPEGQDEKLLANKIMQENKNVKSVLNKISGRRGEYRTREYELIDGDHDTEVLHKEYGYWLKLDPQKTYFSPREATERQRVAEQVKPNEIVMVMFSGIGAYAIAIAKRQPQVRKIILIEINPAAVTYAKENIRINKVAHLVALVEGDVKNISPNFSGQCDRIIMPLPLGAEKFLAEAINCAKGNGIIHYYTVGEEKSLPEKIEFVEKTANKLKRKIEILAKQKVSPYSPHKSKYRIDFQVT